MIERVVGNVRQENGFDDSAVRKRGIRRVTFDSSNHVSVLFQVYGSVWPHVLPYCLANVLITYGVAYLKKNGIDVTIASNGHTFMSVLVSFLIVARTQITYARFMEARGYLQDTYRSCRDLIHTCSLLTCHDMCDGAKQWRQDVAYRTILLLRITMSALEFQSRSVNAMDFVDGSNKYINTEEESRSESKKRLKDWTHGKRDLSDENFRAPIVLAYNLRSEIMKQRQGGFLDKKRKDTKTYMHVNEELKVLGMVSDYVAAFHGLKKLITTPFPFPLVQMARTFLFFWVFTIPFAIVGDISEPIEAMIINFFITYGFIGLEYVSMELDDPYGDDPNDFDNVGMAQMVFEDIYITIYKTDGTESADTLRSRVWDRCNRINAFQRDLDDDLNSSLKAISASTIANLENV